MDPLHYKEMKQNLEALFVRGFIQEKDIYIFGHCNASEELADLLISRGCSVSAILDNNPAKQGNDYKGIPIIPPQAILDRDRKRMLICIVSRAYEAMARQLRQMGYWGGIEKLVDYNTFAEYSLSFETIYRKRERAMRGVRILEEIRKKYPSYFYLLCPFSALGDVYYAMAYLNGYLDKHHIVNYVVLTVGRACSEIAAMFGCTNRETLSQRDMDELVQAVLFTRAREAFIAHHDRPYANLLIKALNVKLVPFELLYRCGVFGLEKDVPPSRPMALRYFSGRDSMAKGKSVVISPYAKSVAGIGSGIWEQIICHYQRKGFQVYTNVTGEEKPLSGTVSLRADLMEFQSAVEWAGTFIGVRSGLCDVIKEAHCRKVVLFPDCYYSDTRWKVADFFHLEGWENIIVEEQNGKGKIDLIDIGQNVDI